MICVERKKTHVLPRLVRNLFAPRYAYALDDSGPPSRLLERRIGGSWIACNEEDYSTGAQILQREPGRKNACSAEKQSMAFM
jgi:hypothetical protein